MLPLLDDHTQLLNRYMKYQTIHRYKTSVGSINEEKQNRKSMQENNERRSSNSLPKIHKLKTGNPRAQKKQCSSPYKSSPTRLIYNGSAFLKFWKTEKELCSKLSKQISQIERQIRKCQKRLNNTGNEPKSTKKIELQKSQKSLKKPQKTAFLTQVNENIGNTAYTRPNAMDYVKEYKQNMEHQYKSDLRNSYIRRKSLVEARGVDLSKLNILGQRNSLPKCGKPSSNSEHIFRVLTKEGTPVSICPSVPNFGCVRNSQTKNVLSYCLDNRRFMESNVKNLRSLLRVR